MRKRIISVIAFILFMVMLIPTSVSAATTTISGGTTSGSAFDISTLASGDVLSIDTASTVYLTGSQNITITSTGVDVNLVLKDVTVASGGCPITFAANSTNTITLLGDNTLTAGGSNPGVYVPSTASLTIDGLGTLSATGTSSGAGIGGRGGSSGSGTVTINGGTITAQGGTCGAGIGGGGATNATNGTGNVIINGGTINATGGNYGAGIGGGARSAGTVQINGGEITAAGGGSAAGIGGGGNTANTNNGGAATVTINGGTIVSATGNSNGAGIGSGKGSNGGNVNSNVTITGGTITLAQGGVTRGAGIGSGYNAGANVIISGGIITSAIGGRTSSSASTGGAGIGGGHYGRATVTITGGTITSAKGGGGGGSTASGGGAGIGGGGGNKGTVIISETTGTTVVNATNGPQSAAIGGGSGGAADVTITGGTVTATASGSYGAGIGSGNSATGTNVAVIEITGGTVTATGAARAPGIGCGRLWSAGTTTYSVAISGGTVYAIAGGYGAGIGSGEIASSGTSPGTIDISGDAVVFANGSTSDIGDGRDNSGATLSISGTSKVLLRNDRSVTPVTSTHVHTVSNEYISNYSAFGITNFPWTNRTGYGWLPQAAVVFDPNYTDVDTGSAATTTAEIVGTGELLNTVAPTVTRLGYTFAGWSSNPSGAPVFDLTKDRATNGLTLYAKWEAIPVSYLDVTLLSGTVGDTFSFNVRETATGGSGRYTYALATGSSLPAGLSLDTDGSLTGTPTTAVSGATFDVKITDNVNGETATATMTMTVNPANTYNVVYFGNSNDGGTVPTDSGVYTKDQNVTVIFPATPLTRTGYTFAGWSDGDTTYTAAGTSSFAMGTANVFLTAVWTPAAITYDNATLKNGAVNVAYHGSVAMATDGSGSFTYALADGSSLPSGLSLNADGTLTGTPTAVVSGATFDVKVTDNVNGETATATMTMTIDQTYTVTYVGDGTESGGSAPTDTTLYTGGSTFTVKGNTGNLTKADYILAGWNDGDDTYLLGSTYTVGSANVTLTAVWMPVPVDYYALSFQENGGSTVDSVTRAAGTTVDLSNYTTTRRGYTFTDWYSDSGLTEKVTSITLNSNEVVYAGWESSLSDVLDTVDHMAYVYGYADNTIRPNENITRAETATFFYRLLDSDLRDEIFTGNNSFSDVTGNLWYNKAVSSMEAGGYICGYSDGTFCGDHSITRAEFIAIAARFMDAQTGTVSFSDVSTSDWAYKYIATAVYYGWIEGYPDGTFQPDQPITRAEAMTIINRMLDRGVGDSGVMSGFKVWTDNDSSAWYYYEVIEATNDHTYTGIRPNETWTSLTTSYTFDIDKYERP